MGLVLAYLMNLATYPLTGQPVPFRIDAGHVFGCFGAALLIAVGAAIFPARRAARLQVVEALRYE
jgi:ABC-type lipoprotein release transport system permease subunit